MKARCTGRMGFDFDLPSLLETGVLRRSYQLQSEIVQNEVCYGCKIFNFDLR